MVGNVKYRNLIDENFKLWEDIPVASIYSLDVLVKHNGKFIAKMQWEGVQPDRGVQYIEHYQQCESCQKLAHEGRAYAIFLFCGNRFVYGYDLRNRCVIPHIEEYKQYLRSLM